MFPRRKRLSRQALAVVSASPSAKRATSEHFSAICLPTDANFIDAGSAVVVSKKVAKTSVARHLLKRRIKAFLATKGVLSSALIVYARAGSPTLPYADLATELEALLPRVDAYRTM